MKKTTTYADTVDIKDKKLIWNLYFFKMFSYDDLIVYFDGKYTYAQLKSIIIERLKMERKNRGNASKIFK